MIELGIELGIVLVIQSLALQDQFRSRQGFSDYKIAHREVAGPDSLKRGL